MRISDWSSDVCSSDLCRWRAETSCICDGIIAPDNCPEIAAGGELMEETAVDDEEFFAATRLSVDDAGKIHAAFADEVATRSEERRVGKECVRTSRSRWSP